MNLESIAHKMDVGNAQAFVRAAHNLISAIVVEAARQKDVQGPGSRDYRTGDLSREAAPGGWISQSELDRACQQMSEAMAAEKWTQGVVAAVRAILLLK